MLSALTHLKTCPHLYAIGQLLHRLVEEALHLCVSETSHMEVLWIILMWINMVHVSVILLLIVRIKVIITVFHLLVRHLDTPEKDMRFNTSLVIQDFMAS